MLRWIYKMNKSAFYDLLVEDFYGELPSTVKEPSIEFLKNARPTLERFWSIQAYNIQRRSISDPKNAQFYQGFLLCIRTLLAIVSKGSFEKPQEIKTEAPKKTPADMIKDFITEAKKK